MVQQAFGMIPRLGAARDVVSAVPCSPAKSRADTGCALKLRPMADRAKRRLPEYAQANGHGTIHI